MSVWTTAKYTSCIKYNATGAVATENWNALNHQTLTDYDETQGMLPTSVTDVNNKVTLTATATMPVAISPLRQRSLGNKLVPLLAV